MINSRGCDEYRWRQTHYDFRISLLWLRAIEIITGQSPKVMMSELEMTNLFVPDPKTKTTYRSPWRA